jgi:molybdopterin-guanine dinucleotide biosynthesis protein A
MGHDKAWLPFGPETMLQRVVRLVGEVVPLSNIVVVTAIDRTLPALPPEIVTTHDRSADRGPLEGFHAGLAVCQSSLDAVYLTSCDVPMLIPAFVAQMFELLEHHDAAVPSDETQLHPLAGVYRPTVINVIEQLLADDQLRLRNLFEHVRTRTIPVEQLREIDPELRSLMNLNSPEDYRSALRLANISLDETNNATFNS